MNSIIKWVVAAVAVVLIVWLGYSALSGGRTSSETEPIKIGVVGPLTGNLAFIGEGIRDAVLLAKEELGETRYQYEVIFEDDQLDPKKTASAANKLISIDNVDAIISVSSGTGNVITPIAEQNRVVHFGIASDANIAKGDYNFIHWTPPSEENKVFVAELQRRGIEKLGIFKLNQQGEIAIVDDLRERIKGTNINIVTDQTLNFGEKDFRSIIAKVKNSGAEIYLLLAFSPELEILAKQIKEAGINTPLTSIEAFELTEQVDLFEGEWYVNPADPTEVFANQFKGKTSKTPTLAAANSYDIFNLIVTAAEEIRKSIKPTPEEIAAGLTNIKNFDGALGNLSVNEDGIVISKAVVRMIKDGQPVTIDN